MSEQSDEWPITASVRLYDLLLLAYPKAFKREYGQSMLQVFRDCCRDAYIRDGAVGLMRLWMRTLGDLATSVPKERAAISTARRAAVRTRLVVAKQPGRNAMGVRSYDRFTKRSKQVLQLATEESRAFNHPHIGTEHLLLGLIREGEGVAARVLDNQGVKLSQARHAVAFIVGFGQQAPTESRDLTERANKLIEYAVEEAKRMNHHYIGTEHLLLGMVKLREGVATGVFDMLGVGLDDVHFEVMRILRQGAYTSSGSAIDQHIQDQLKLVYGSFSKRARMALNAAVEEAATLGATHIGPTHILAGLIHEQDGLAAQVLARLDVKLLIRQATEGASEQQPTPAIRMELSDTAKTVIARAVEEALLRNHDYLGTEHLLLALCREPNIAPVFTQSGVTPEQVREAVLEALARG